MVKKSHQPRPSKSKVSSTPITKVKPPTTSPQNPPKEPGPESTPPALSPEDLKHQQILLNIFQDTFRDVLASETFNTTLQEVKQALYNRDFDKAFGSSADYLDVYAARWSPTRALCYSRILADITDIILPQEPSEQRAAADGDEVATDDDDEQRRPTTTLRMLAIGGAAAELAAFASFLRILDDEQVHGTISLLDMGPWQQVTQKLHRSLTTAPPLSKYASAAARAANTAFVSDSRFQSTFTQQDILTLDGGEEQLMGLLGASHGDGHGDGHGDDVLLVTILFTLNELYTSGGIAKTTAFLRALTACIPLNSLLLVVDSPGSYSETAVGKEAKKYPMHWLLDHTLLKSDNKQADIGRGWEKLESHDSIWFRIADGLHYPIPLENMRYQIHLYRAVPRGAD